MSDRRPDQTTVMGPQDTAEWVEVYLLLWELLTKDTALTPAEAHALAKRTTNQIWIRLRRQPRTTTPEGAATDGLMRADPSTPIQPVLDAPTMTPRGGG